MARNVPTELVWDAREYGQLHTARRQGWAGHTFGFGDDGSREMCFLAFSHCRYVLLFKLSNHHSFKLWLELVNQVLVLLTGYDSGCINMLRQKYPTSLAHVRSFHYT